MYVAGKKKNGTFYVPFFFCGGIAGFPVWGGGGDASESLELKLPAPRVLMASEAGGR